MNQHFRPSSTDFRRLLVVELNEFDPAYLRTMARTVGLNNIARVLAYRHASTATEDTIEHQGLDPWVQWAGIHSGKPSAEHGIRRLGMTRAQGTQLWHALAKEGRTWGVWGAMNAPMGDPSGGRFFMPDPWSFEERAFPAYLADVLALPRYVATNYLDLDYKRVFGSALRLARFFAPARHWPLLARFSAVASKAAMRTGPSVHTFATLLDYLSVLCFIKLRRDHRPDLSVVFLNNMAHLQHHFWLPGPELHPQMKLGLELSDAMLGLLLDDRDENEALIVMNGLRQENVSGQGSFVYRQCNPQIALEAIGVTGGRVEPCMTHDGTILFTSGKDAERAFELLGRCQLSDGTKAFFVERQGPMRVFYQLTIEHEVDAGTQIVTGNNSIRFHDLFALVSERTGAHVPEGDIFYDGLVLPSRLQNHEIYHHVLNHFRESAALDDVRSPELA
jgi:hypothetical protein